jgi:acetylglutamate kinase
MKIVIKFAGALLEDKGTVQSLAEQTTSLAAQGHEILVVHGGGRTFTATLKRLGIESKFVAGLRVTDRETRDVAVMVFAGLLNKQLAAAISAAGRPAVGISAADAQCFLAEPLVHNDVKGSLGYVGYLTGLNAKLLETFWKAGIVPVAACLGLGSDGELYNINADHMAAACAEYLQADHLIYLTDVLGVLDGDRILSGIACDEIGDLLQRKIVSGGMVLKLEAAKRALEGGVSGVHIIGGTIPGGLLATVRAAESTTPAFADEVPGTRILREPIAVDVRFAHSVHSAAHSAA